MRDEGTDETLPAPGATRRSDPVLPQQTHDSEGAPVVAMIPKTPMYEGHADFDDLVTVDPANYTILKELARGGMGRILEARDRRLGRRVAIKEVMHLDETALVRFEREARITARLQHPGIVHVHEAGLWPSGQPFYAMKLIRGKPLDARLATARTLAERLELLPAVISVVDALAFAHSENVIHRDLKPANVLVGDFGETVVIDWGIAKDLSASETDNLAIGPYRNVAQDQDAQTIEGAIIGTPAYMPPEQAAGERVDARADVYALGALLYQLLAGRPPYEGRTTAEVLDRVLEWPPPPLAEREPEAPADLVAITEKAMARSPAARFPSAREMVAELKRFQTGQLVTSRRYTKWELVQRWVRRYRAAVAVGVIAISTLAVLGIVGVAKIIDERNRADVEAVAANDQADEGKIAFASQMLDTDPTMALAILKQLEGRTQWNAARVIAADAAQRGVARVLDGDEDTNALAIDAEGKRLAAYSYRGRILVWDLATATARQLWPLVRIYDLAFDGANGLVAIEQDGRIRRWDLTTGESSIVREIAGEWHAMNLAPDGSALIASNFQTSHYYDLTTNTDRELPRYSLVAWAPDARSALLVTRNHLGRIDRLDRTTGAITVVKNDAQAVLAATDGTRMWATRGNTIEDLGTGEKLEMPAHVTEIEARDGRFAAASSISLLTWNGTSLAGRTREGHLLPIDPKQLMTGDHSLHLSDNGDLGRVALRGHTSPVQRIALGPHGLVISAEQNGQIRIWSRPPVARDLGTRVVTTSRAWLTADRRELVNARLGPELEVRDLATRRIRRISVVAAAAGLSLPDHRFEAQRTAIVGRRRFMERSSSPTEEVAEASQSADGRRIVTVDGAKGVVVWDLDTNRGTVLVERGIHAVINGAGTHVVLSREDPDSADHHLIERWTIATLTAERLGRMQATAIAIGHDDSIAVSTNEGSLWLFQHGLATNHRRDVYTHRSVAFSPDGRWLVGAADDGHVRLWNLAGDDAVTWSGHLGTVTLVAFSPDGKHVASTSADKTVRVWHVPDGAVTVFSGHTEIVTSLRWDDANTLVTTSLDHTARICDIRTNRSRALEGQDGEIVFAGHISEHRVIVVDRGLQVAEFADNLPHGEEMLRAWLESATNLTRGR